MERNIYSLSLGRELTREEFDALDKCVSILNAEDFEKEYNKLSKKMQLILTAFVVGFELSFNIPESDRKILQKDFQKGEIKTVQTSVLMRIN